MGPSPTPSLDHVQFTPLPESEPAGMGGSSASATITTTKKVAFVVVIGIAACMVITAALAAALIPLLDWSSANETSTDNITKVSSASTYLSTSSSSSSSPPTASISISSSLSPTYSTSTIAFINTTRTTQLTSTTTSTTTTATTTTITSFPFPECLPTQFQCTDGQCLPSSSVCNKVYECPDQSDEANCPDCQGFQCAKTNVCLWNGISGRCDGVLDCTDLSDEIGCRLSPRYKLCANGVRVKSTLWCNGLDDCRDNSDERECDCQRFEMSCGSETKGRCIPRLLKCDGYPDCDNGTDEKGCASRCGENEFQCSDNSCIPRESKCDEKVDCPGDGVDEQGCMEKDPNTHILTVQSDGMAFPICSDGWTDDHSRAFCYSQRKRTRCKSGKVVHVRCKYPTCGERKQPVLKNAVAGGRLAPLGKWPWIASLAHRNSPICGAVIVDTHWVLTAFHCVMKYYSRNLTDSSNPPYHFTITYGTINSTSTTTTTTNIDSNQIKYNKSHLRHVVSIHPHPRATVQPNGGVNWDLALLRLHTPIVYSDIVQPLCLPALDHEVPQNAVCFLAGWGIMSESQYLKPSLLRDTRLRVLSKARCQRNTEIGEDKVNTNSTICAGYYFGRPSGCEGDSGGPLMCLEASLTSTPTPRWSLAGVLSRTNSLCGKFQPNSLANRFARVSTSMTWIRDTISGG